MKDITNATFWLEPGILISYGSALDAEKHRHHSLQIIWPTADSLCQVFDQDNSSTQEFSGALLINSQVEHKLQMQQGWVLLIEAQSFLAQALTSHLEQQQGQVLSIDCQSPLFDLTQLTKLSANDILEQYFQPLFEELKINFEIHNHSYCQVADLRIQKILAELDLSLPINGRSAKEQANTDTNFKAHHVAKKLAISESRFLHLFSQQMNMPWRPYILWRRMMCAISLIKQGSDATNAAHMAGFSDSAHFSRSFRSLFGMSLRQALSLLQSER